MKTRTRIGAVMASVAHTSGTSGDHPLRTSLSFLCNLDALPLAPYFVKNQSLPHRINQWRPAIWIMAVLTLLFLGGINIAQGGAKPTSQDISKIQPPGGVPLAIVGARGEYTVEGINKVRKRLEAVPEEDLEKWVVELERIMAMKLKDGLPSARQACRTDFAIHLSVAFDDFKWNAKAADKLFQRAQSLPASEAKAWKETFEALLKKEIGQSDTSNYAGGPAWAVPLVLIPVDALHEGQKYSAERGRKYLARLKQLTADDVSLWKTKVDQFGGTELDAAINIILLDDYFDQEKFQRDKFKAAISTILTVTFVAAGGQTDRPAHESLSVYEAGNTNWFRAVWTIVHATNGAPDLIHELSCPERKHRELAESVLQQLYSDRHPQDPSTPTNSVAWMKWWEQAGKTNKVQRLWHNFDSHYK